MKTGKKGGALPERVFECSSVRVFGFSGIRVFGFSGFRVFWFLGVRVFWYTGIGFEKLRNQQLWRQPDFAQDH